MLLTIGSLGNDTVYPCGSDVHVPSDTVFLCICLVDSEEISGSIA